ncbi:MAG: hypothetical protein IT318_27150 [Anaerolineales bacterium]|nr:hypothetical protein [Anaerolineales bacterium]
MIRPPTPFAVRYLDFGKVFVPNGALDFSTLAFSDQEVARYGPHLFNRGLVFPETSPFARQIGAVSAALLVFESGYLFTLVQRRREGELSAPGAARTDRPFNQVRFVLLSRETIEQAFAARAALYTSLAAAARAPEARGWLGDYTSDRQEIPWSPRLDRLEPALPDPEAIRFVVNALVAAACPAGAPSAAARPQPISVPLPGQDWLEKLRLVEAAQYWLLPRLGVISFALDYVSLQNVHLRLFPLPADAPAPLPSERVFGPGLAAGRFSDDYYVSVHALGHEALYDPALPGLLALPMPAETAVTLYQVERQAQPLPGADALRLYPELGRLGERRWSLLRRVPREDVLALLRQPDLPGGLRLDLLQSALESEHGLLTRYAPFHLAVPRPVRADERLRALLRTAVSKSPETALAVGAPEEQAALYRDLLEARRALAPASRGAAPAAPPLALATGHPLLEALFLRQRTPALAAAVRELTEEDTALFGEALSVIDPAVDLEGALWLWRQAGRGDAKHYAALLERVVQPAWYPALGRHPGLWRELLEAGRDLALRPASDGQVPALEAQTGALLRALPPALAPFVWQASLAVAAVDGPFAEWWLFYEALALPDQLPELWSALQRLPIAALLAAGPQLKHLLGRGAADLSLLQACTPPGHATPDEALYAVALRAWLEAGFRSALGDLALATDDVAFLISLLPESNELLAAIAASPAQAPAIRALPPGQALAWSQSACGERRQPYRPTGADKLFERLIELHSPDEALLWHLLVEDEGTSAAAMPWPAYAALAARLRARLAAQPAEAETRLQAFLALASELQNPAVPEAFAQNQIDLRRTLALLATHPADPQQAAALLPGLLPLAVFHLQGTSARLRERAAALIRAGLQHPEATTYLQTLPDTVLAYLRQSFASGSAALDAAGHWIEAELSRRTNAYRIVAPAQRVRAQSAPPLAMPTRPLRAADAPPATRAPIEEPLPASLPAPTRTGPPAPPVSSAPQPGVVPLPPGPPPPGAAAADPADTAAALLLGELALPTAAPKKRDGAMLLWLLVVVIVAVMLAVAVGVVIYVRSLSAAAAWLPSLSPLLAPYS